MESNKKILKRSLIIIGFLLLFINLAILKTKYPYYHGILELIVLLGDVITEYIGECESILSILGFLCLFIGILINSHDSDSNKKKLYYKIHLIVGLLPFIGVIIYGIFSAINGFTFIYSTSYGLEAFSCTVIIMSLLIWPYYIIGLALIIKGIFKIKSKKIT